jgi:hypothetical protein
MLRRRYRQAEPVTGLQGEVLDKIAGGAPVAVPERVNLQQPAGDVSGFAGKAIGGDAVELGASRSREKTSLISGSILACGAKTTFLSRPSSSTLATAMFMFRYCPAHS